MACHCSSANLQAVAQAIHGNLCRCQQHAYEETFCINGKVRNQPSSFRRLRSFCRLRSFLRNGHG